MKPSRRIDHHLGLPRQRSLALSLALLAGTIGLAAGPSVAQETPSPTEMPSPESTLEPTSTPTEEPSPTPVATPTPEPTAPASPSPEPTPTATPSTTPTATPSTTPTATPSTTPTATGTPGAGELGPEASFPVTGVQEDSELAFEPNAGQVDGAVDFVSRNGDLQYFIADGDLTIVVPGGEPEAVVASFLRRTADPQPIEGDVTGYPVNYLLGNDPSQWRRQIRAVESVTYPDLYDGIDLQYLADGDDLRYDLIVQPGADPAQIAIAWDGAGVTVDQQGRLVLDTERDRTLRFAAPIAYQTIDGQQESVEVAYAIGADGVTVGFDLGEYDPSHAVVIDPTLEYSTFIGGSGTENVTALALDTSGNPYTIGSSSSADYPTTAGAYDQTANGSDDIVVTKWNTAGTAIVWSTYIGGSGSDTGWALAVDGTGAVHLAGHTLSSNFPTTAGAYDTTYAGNTDVVVAKLAATGASLTWSSYLGGNGPNDYVDDLELDSAGNTVVSGQTDSTNWPTTGGAFDTTAVGIAGYVTELNTTGTALVFSTFIDGNGTDRVNALDIETSGRIVLAGRTTSTDFPIVTRAYDTSSNGGQDGFVAVLAANGATLPYSTYLGGTTTDEIADVVTTEDNRYYLTGNSQSSNFPTTSDAYDTSHNGSDDVVVALLDIGLAPTNQLRLASFLGGSAMDTGLRALTDRFGRIVVVGQTQSPSLATAGAYDTTYGGSQDAFVARFSPDGASLRSLSYLGSNGTDVGRDIAIHTDDDWWVTGFTSGTDFPTTGGAYDTTVSGTDGYLVRFGATDAFTVNSTADVQDQTPGDGTCATGNLILGQPECTLRAAIGEINASGTVDAISLPAGTYGLGLSGATEDANANGDLDVLTSVTIAGAGSGSTTVDGNDLDRVFDVLSPARLTLRDLTVTDGTAATGGGVRVASGAAAWLTDVVVIANTATGAGGGVANSGNLVLTDTRLTANSASSTGGGLHNAGTALVHASTIDANSSTSNGGGVNNADAAGTVTLVNSTISGNSTASTGGGLQNANLAYLTNVTITANTATSGGGGILETAGDTTQLRNTILAGNAHATSPDMSGTVESLGNNLVSSTSGSSGWVGGDSTGVSAQLAALGSYGGSTPTHPPLSTSPALNAATTTAAPLVDQRGVLRDATPDIGAYQGFLTGFVVNSTGDAVDNNAGNGVCSTGGTNSQGAPACTLRAAIQEANALAGTDTINFAIPTTEAGYTASPVSFRIQPTALLPNISTPMVIDGSTQAQYSSAGRPVVIVDGINVVSGEQNGLYLTGGSATVRGLNLQRWLDDAIDIEFAGGNTVVGNYIGVNTTGTAAAANAWGVNIKTANNVVGGTTAADRNVISGSTQDGFYIYQAAAINNTVTGNYIGVGADGVTPIGNSGHGVYIHSSATNSRVGGFTAGAANVIANNGSDGVRVEGNSTNGIAVIGNSIRANGGLAIGLGTDGATANDAGDGDTGPNTLINYPTITSIDASGGNLTIAYRLDHPSGDYRIDVYNNTAVDPSGYGEAQTHLGSSFVAKGSGVTSHTITVPGTTGDLIAMTATYCVGSTSCTTVRETSELSPVRRVGSAVLNAVHSGLATIAGGATTTTATLPAVDTTKAFLTFSLRGSFVAPQDGAVTGVLTNATTVTFTRVGTTGVVSIEWQVVEFSSGVTVQRGVTAQSATTVNVAVSPANPGSSFPLLSTRATGTNWDSSSFVSGALTSPTNLRLRAITAGSATTAWQVVTYDNAIVQSGAIAFATGDSTRTATITTANTAKSWLLYTSRTANGTTANIGQKLIRGQVTNGTTLTFDRSSTGQTLDVEWYLVEFTDTTTVQHANAAFAAADTTNNVAITAVDPARAIGVGGYQQTGGRSAYTANDNPGVAWFTTRLTTATNLRIQRDANLAVADVGWFVVHWPGTAAPLVVNSTADTADNNPGDGYCWTGANNTAGNRACTLRAAIEEANANPYANQVDFAIPATESGHSGGVWTISPGPTARTISTTMTIDGTTQPGWTATPVVQLDGLSAGGNQGFVITGDNVEIRGLAIGRFATNAILVESGAAGTLIAGNHLGTDASGTVDRGNGARGVDLTIGSGPTTVGGALAADRNLISGNDVGGIVIWGSNDNLVIGNYIGTDITGNAPLGNALDGISFGNGSTGNIIGQPDAGNVLSGNGNDGLEIDDATGGNTIQANTIGLGADASTVVANGRHGIVLYNGANTTQIGGSGSGEGNVISGNTSEGVHINGNANGATTANVIEGNTIGLDATGTIDKGNGSHGVHIFNGANGTVVGGATAAHGNVISGNGSGAAAGVYITGATTINNVVQHNHIGTNAAGDTAVMNNLHGLWIDDAPGTDVLDNLVSGNNVHGVYVSDTNATGTEILRNTIGTNLAANAGIPNGYDGVRLEGSSSGTIVGSPGNGNIVSGNTLHGVNINSSSNNTVQANVIGTDTASGTLDLGNGLAGVYTDVLNSSNNTIGGDGLGEGNTIALNSDGIQLESGTNNAILGNSIYGNSGLGIDLVGGTENGFGVTANDAGDGDTGANGLLNYPVITSATESAGTVTVTYNLDVPAGNYRVEFFDNATADGSGHGEGQTFLSAVTATPGAGLTHAFAGTIGDIVTMTATQDLGAGTYGPTSEVSAAFTATGPLDPVVLDGIQKGTATLGPGSSSVTATIAAVDPTKAFLTFNVRGNDDNPDNISVTGELTNATTVTFTRPGTVGTLTIEWSVVEFSSGVTVQRGTATLSAATTNIPINAVDLTRSFPLTSVRTVGVTFDQNDFVSASLTASTNLRLSITASNSNTVPWQVITYNDATVQSGSVAFAAGDSSKTATITAVDTTQAWLMYTTGTATGTGTNIGQKMIRGQVTNSTTLTFDRSSTGQTMNVEWYLVEFTDTTTVQHASAAFAAADTTNNVTITAVDPARAISAAGTNLTGGRSAYTADDNPGTAWFTTRLTTATNLRIQRDAALATADVGWFVIHWPGATGPVTVNSTADTADNNPGDGYCWTGANNTAGNRACTLRAAIQEANANPDANTINFNIPTTETGHASGVWTFTPSSQYDFITSPVTIDASTQPGWVGSPVIQLDGTSAIGATSGLVLRTDDSTIRGFIVHSFPDEGLEIDGFTGLGDNNTVTNNWIGFDAALAARPNADVGLLVTQSAAGNTIGGTGAFDANVIGFGANDGIVIRNSGSIDNVVIGNIIGRGPNGITPMPNTRHGVYLYDLVTNNRIGGTTTAEANRIIGNGGDGINLETDTDPANTILGNQIWANSGLGIDLVGGTENGFGVTANDAGDGDTGANGLLNYPVISSATVSAGTVAVNFDLDVPAGTYRVQFFENPSGADPSGHGEGQTLVHSTDVTHPGGGSSPFATSFTGSVGDVITATATACTSGTCTAFTSTSEFAAVFTAVTLTAARVPDSSGRHADLFLGGGLDPFASVAGIAGPAMASAGGTERLVGPPVDSVAGELTISGWANLDVMTLDPRILAKSTSTGNVIYELLVDGTTAEAVGRMRIGGTIREVRGGTLATSTWHHVVATWDGAELALYVDGVEVDRVAAAGTLATDPSLALTVANTADAARGLAGAIDELRVLSSARPAAWIATERANLSDPAAMVRVGATQTQAPGSWTTTSAQSRSGAVALAAPTTPGTGADAWVVAQGLDEPGVAFDSWWWLTTDTGVITASGTRSGLVPTDQYETAVMDPSGWDLRRNVGGSITPNAPAAGSTATGRWVKVSIWTDQDGRSRVLVDDVEIIGWTNQGPALQAGSVGLRVGLLPAGEAWYVDDARARRLVIPEPVTALGPLDRN